MDSLVQSRSIYNLPTFNSNQPVPTGDYYTGSIGQQKKHITASDTGKLTFEKISLRQASGAGAVNLSLGAR